MSEHRTIALTRGMVALVDVEDFDAMNALRWYAHRGSSGGGYYAIRHVLVGGKRKQVQMARFILDAPDGMVVDHINGDTLDNRRANIRIATQRQNKINTRRRNVSGFRGVVWDRCSWKAGIKVNGKRIHLGHFHNAKTAGVAYDIAAVKYFGEFAILNFPVSAPPPTAAFAGNVAVPVINAALSGDGRLTGAALPHEAASDKQPQPLRGEVRGIRCQWSTAMAVGLFVHQSQGAAFNRPPSTPMGHTAFGGSRKIVGEEA